MNRRYWLVLAILLIGPIARADDFIPTNGSEAVLPIKIQAASPRNVYRVDDVLFRSGRLRPDGAALLESLGVRTVVSLRIVRRDERSVRGSNLRYFQIPIKVWRPTEDQIVQFLRIAVNPEYQPVCVYCTRGAERTGMMVAAYRIVVCGWSKDDAIREMTQGPYDYHERWWQVVALIRNLDVDRVKRRIGLYEQPVIAP